ncbi:hypothetical protein ATB53_01305 [Xanthomonas translucens]|uniref:Uncharacterized protein n=1 Tax=Xanthomonas campestris pv. translucens TaxID=343 RepID=A0A109HH72_XANCT|nr:hypothetical protein ATB53_01305 [Xanthomonas translucens]
MAQFGDNKVHRWRAFTRDEIFGFCQRRFERSKLVDKCAQTNVTTQFVNAFHMEAQNSGFSKLVYGAVHGDIL